MGLLRDFGQYLIETNDSDATYYSSFATNLAIAIHTQFDANANLWLWCDVPSPAGDAWYPNLTAQIYPHLYDVHSTDAASGDGYRLHRGFEVLTQAVPDWSTLTPVTLSLARCGLSRRHCVRKTQAEALPMLLRRCSNTISRVW